MSLAVYNTCSRQEKRAVMRAFWSGRFDDSHKINQAAKEYGPYALGLVTIVTLEIVFIATLLVIRANGWAWTSTAGSVLALWSLWWTVLCRRTINSGPPWRE
jgi:hypothetical protein